MIPLWKVLQSLKLITGKMGRGRVLGKMLGMKV